MPIRMPALSSSAQASAYIAICSFNVSLEHDSPNEKRYLTLQHLIHAMDKDSVFLINDMVVSDQGALISGRRSRI